MSLAQHWMLDPSVRFLNHGSFGACPRAVLEHQQALRDALERQPVRFFVDTLLPALDAARKRVAAFVGADPEGLVFVPNATAAVNAVLRSWRWRAGDEILITDHAYNACANVARFVASRSGARVVTAAIPFPVTSPGEVVERILSSVTSRTRLALVSHVSSPTGVVFPVEVLVSALAERGVETLVDGAHGPGMVPLSLEALGAAYYTGNCHKWMCSPKGAGLLYVREDCRAGLHPATISHGVNVPRVADNRLHAEFDWIGTIDPSPWLCVPRAIEVMESLVEGGWPAIMERNRALVLRGREVLCEALEVDPPCPESMVGSLAAVALPDALETREADSPLYTDPLRAALLKTCGVEVPVVPWPAPPRRWVRISAQLYNTLEDYRVLAQALKRLV